MVTFTPNPSPFLFGQSSHSCLTPPPQIRCTINSGEDIQFMRTANGDELEGTSDAQAVDIWNLVLLTCPMIVITLIGTTLFIIVVIVALIVCYHFPLCAILKYFLVSEITRRIDVLCSSMEIVGSVDVVHLDLFLCLQCSHPIRHPTETTVSGLRRLHRVPEIGKI